MRGLWLTERAICQRARDLGAAAVRGIITSFPEASVSFLLLFFFDFLCRSSAPVAAALPTLYSPEGPFTFDVWPFFSFSPLLIRKRRTMREAENNP